MLSHGYYFKGVIKKIKQVYPDALLIAISLHRYRYLGAKEWHENFIWLKELAPSQKLLEDWNDLKITYDEYVTRYLDEQDNPEARATRLLLVSKAEIGPVILFCHCGPDEGNHCHRFLQMDLITEEAKKAGLNIELINRDMVSCIRKELLKELPGSMKKLEKKHRTIAGSHTTKLPAFS
jgi:uncharacterized protein YeaO (DUF488 family)